MTLDRTFTCTQRVGDSSMDHPSVVPSRDRGVSRSTSPRACIISRRGSPDSRQMHCGVKDPAGRACARIPAPGEQKLRHQQHARRVCWLGWRPRAVVSRALCHRLWFSAKVDGRTRHRGRRGAAGYRGNTRGRPRAGFCGPHPLSLMTNRAAQN